MSLSDPLEPFRIGPGSGWDDIERQATRDGQLILREWRKGKTPLALTKGALLFLDEDTLFRVRKGEVRSFGMTRAASTKKMRWGLLCYFGALPFVILQPVVALALALAGGWLTTSGFLSKAVLVQVTDDRVPPFVLVQGNWKRLRAALGEWK